MPQCENTEQQEGRAKEKHSELATARERERDGVCVCVCDRQLAGLTHALARAFALAKAQQQQQAQSSFWQQFWPVLFCFWPNLSAETNSQICHIFNSFFRAVRLCKSMRRTLGQDISC